MVSASSLKAAVKLSANLGHVLIATSDSDGVPHVASAGPLIPQSDQRLLVSAWFCPGTMANLEHNPNIAIVIWDAASDQGHQLIGLVEKTEESAVLDGYAPDEEGSPPLPQVLYRLEIRISRVMAYSRAPHADIEE